MAAYDRIEPQIFGGERANGSPACTTFNEQVSVAWVGMGNTRLNVQAFGKSKVILPETGRGVGLTTFRTRLQLTWAGTDDNSSLNVISSPDGVTFDPDDKTTLWDISVGGGPSAVEFNGHLYLSWSARSSLREEQTLQIISSADGRSFTQPVTLPETSAGAPAMAVFQNRLYIAWCGTDARTSLNVMSSADGELFDFRHPDILVDTSSTHPALCALDSELFLAWRGRDDGKSLNIMSTRDGQMFQNKRTYPYGSLFSPALARSLWNVSSHGTTYTYVPTGGGGYPGSPPMGGYPGAPPEPMGGISGSPDVRVGADHGVLKTG
jgi:hypothetical protein